nr:hypothetical protein [Anaerohalosphaeraceae bacterium]
HPNKLKGFVHFRLRQNRRTPLYDAVAVSSLQKVKILIKYGAKKEIKDKEGISPLQLAKTHDLQEIVFYLEHD